MSNYNIPFELDAEHRRCVVGGEPQIFHCHHYNNYLQRTIREDAPFLDARPILVGAAAEVGYAQLKMMSGGKPAAERKKLAEQLFQWAGFGSIKLDGCTDKGGTVSSHWTHYSATWKIKFGKSDYPVDYFATGWIAGALAAIFDKPLGAYTAEQTECLSMGSAKATFKFTEGKANYNIYKSPGVGPISGKHTPKQVQANGVDYNGIFTALTGMPIVGNEDGCINAFGVYLTRHYANYYNRISFEFQRELITKFGDDGRQVAEPLLIEAGHVCAFFTFGGIMTSAEWDAMIKPMLKDKKDWVHGMVAAVNALGWGRWQVTDVTDKGAKFFLHDDYESIGYLGMYGKSKFDVSYLARGGVAGVMDLVYVGDIEKKPGLTPEFYDKLFKSPGSFKVKTLSSRAMGDDVTSFEVYR